MEKIKERLKKFYINKKVRSTSSIIAVLIALMYFFILLLVNNSGSIDCLKNQSILYQLLLVLKEFLVISFFIVTTTLLTSWLIEKDSRNKIYGDIICNDFLASEEFYNTLTDKNRQEMLNNLEKHKYFEDSQSKEDMYKSVTSKLINLKEKYFYNNCAYYIDCSINKGLITKKIKKVIKLRSFKDHVKLDELSLVKLTYAEMAGIKHIELLSFNVAGKNIPLSEVDVIHEEVKNEQLIGCGYNKKTQYLYKKGIDINPNNDVVVVIEYRTIVDFSDKAFACRVAKPCKKFTLEYTLDAETAKTHSLSSYAFGFIDDANGSPHNGSRSSVRATFDDWIFNSDGVAVVITEK